MCWGVGCAQCLCCFEVDDGFFVGVGLYCLCGCMVGVVDGAVGFVECSGGDVVVRELGEYRVVVGFVYFFDCLGDVLVSLGVFGG